MSRDDTLALFMAHRTNLVACFDLLLVLAEGRVHAFGPKDQVLSKLAPAPPVQPVPLKIVTGSGMP